MKHFLMFIFILSTLFFTTTFAQGVQHTEDVWYHTKHQVTDSDSIYYSNDYIYFYGPETLYIFIPTEYTGCNIFIHGTIEGNGAAATINFALAAHKGDGSSLNSDEPETYYSFGSVTADSGGMNSYELWPGTDADLQNRPCRYYTLRMIGSSGTNAKIAITIEYIWNKTGRRF